jgi:hypothetical protein
VPRPGNAPLVLKAQIGMYDVDRIFMDAGSGINLIYAKTLRAMHISLEFLKPIDCSFYGIVPGSANYPLGRIALNDCIGIDKITEGRNSTSKSWTGCHNIMRSSGDPRFAIHGSATLHLPCIKNARTQRNHYGQKKLRVIRPMR